MIKITSIAENHGTRPKSRFRWADICGGS